MVTVTQQATISAAGNLCLHGRQGLALPLEFFDVDGAPRDVTNAPLFFEVEGKFRVALAAGSTPNERVVMLTQEQVGSLVGKEHRFAMRDESGALPDVPWHALVRVTGFSAQPQ